MNNENKITVEMLNDLGVYELRELARSIGVKSPTTKKREQLCDQILKISSGELESAKASNKGRPPKSVTKTVALANEFFPEEILNINREKKEDNFYNSSILYFAESTKQIFDGEQNKVQGYVNSIKGHLFFKNKMPSKFYDIIVYIPNKLACEYNLKLGDKISGIAVISTVYENKAILDSICFINCEDSKTYVRKELDTQQIRIPSVEAKFLEKNYKKGERILLTSKEDPIEKIINFIDKDQTNTKYVILSGEIAPETMFFIKSRSKIEKFLSCYGDDVNKVSENINDAINFCNTYLSDGKDIVLIIYDILRLLSALDMFYAKDSSNYLDHNVNSIQTIKKLIASSKSIEGGSISTISVCISDEINIAVVENELKKIVSENF